MSTKKANKKSVSKVVESKVVVKEPAVDGPRLRKWNLWLAALLAIQALAIAVIGTNKTVTLSVEYPSVDPLATEATGSEIVATASRNLWDIRVAYLVAAFLLVFAAVYFLAATWQRRRYESRLAIGMHDMRWLGLGLGGGLTLMTVAFLTGINNRVSLALLFFSMVVGCAILLCAEEVARREAKKRGMLSRMLYTLGVIAVFVPFVALATTVGLARLYDGYVPGYLYGIYVSLLAAYVIGFLMTQLRIQRRGKWASAMYAERAYMWFILIVASLLAWEIFAGVLQP